MVAETSIRPMRWESFGAVEGEALDCLALVRVAAALMFSSLQGDRGDGFAAFGNFL
jgi:hypothetical protein